MLVLSRKKDECVVINNDIRIVVVEIRGDKVRLGVEAPKEVPVHRSEVYEAINHGGSDLEIAQSFIRADDASGAQPISGDTALPAHPDVVHE
jgi:carbon storage regulator